MSILIEAFLNKPDFEEEFENLGFAKEEKDKIWRAIEDLARYRVLNTILNKLESKDKELFLRQMENRADELMIENLREKIENVENILREEIKAVEMEVLTDMRKIKEQKI